MYNFAYNFGRVAGRKLITARVLACDVIPATGLDRGELPDYQKAGVTSSLANENKMLLSVGTDRQKKYIMSLVASFERQKEKATVRQYCDLCIANNQNRCERLGN